MNLKRPPILGPAIRLAWGENRGLDVTGETRADYLAPLLVSYAFYENFKRNRQRYEFRDWVLDSGAFSVQRAGKTIDLGEYIEFCRHMLATDPQLTEVFALDVIGDWRASLKNYERMWTAGVPAIPAYHVGEPDDVLLGLARDYPKIALGGAVGMNVRARLAWSRQCFARIWPKKVHGFGYSSEASVLTLPWHSVDSTNWMAGPRFGTWMAYGRISARKCNNARVEVEWHLRLERRARARWAVEMAQLDAMENAA